MIIQRSAWLRLTRAEWQPTWAQCNTIQLPKEGPVSQFLSESDLAFQIPSSLCIHPFWVSGECGRGNDFLLFIDPAFISTFLSKSGVRGSNHYCLRWSDATLVRLTCLYSVNFWILLLLHIQTHQGLQLTWGGLLSLEICPSSSSGLHCPLISPYMIFTLSRFLLALLGSSGLLHPKWKQRLPRMAAIVLDTKDIPCKQAVLALSS